MTDRSRSGGLVGEVAPDVALLLERSIQPEAPSIAKYLGSLRPTEFDQRRIAEQAVEDVVAEKIETYLLSAGRAGLFD